MIDAVDLDLGKNDPKNTLECRSIRILDEEITRLRRKLAGLEFARETILRHVTGEP